MFSGSILCDGSKKRNLVILFTHVMIDFVHN
jgi:hypothetical protein